MLPGRDRRGLLDRFALVVAGLSPRALMTLAGGTLVAGIAIGVSMAVFLGEEAPPPRGGVALHGAPQAPETYGGTSFVRRPDPLGQYAPPPLPTVSRSRSQPLPEVDMDPAPKVAALPPRLPEPEPVPLENMPVVANPQPQQNIPSILQKEPITVYPEREKSSQMPEGPPAEAVAPAPAPQVAAVEPVTVPPPPDPQPDPAPQRQPNPEMVRETVPERAPVPASILTPPPVLSPAAVPDVTAPQPLMADAPLPIRVPPPVDEPAEEKARIAALPEAFRDLMEGNGPGFVMEEPLPQDTVVHTPEAKKADVEAVVAALPPALDVAPLPEWTGSLPPWRANAVPTTPWRGPAIAVVIDDLGLDQGRTNQLHALPGPLTLSYLTYARDLRRQMAAGHNRGHELLLHMPMEPKSRTIDPGPDVLKVEYSADRILSKLRTALDRGRGHVGINNHMGSRFTSDPKGMAVVMAELKRRGLMWLDSVTSAQSVGLAVADNAGVPHVGRNVFLDNTPEEGAVMRQLKELESVAREHGTAVGIGHPKDATIAALRKWLPTLAKKGFTLVPISALAQPRSAAVAEATPSAVSGAYGKY